MEVRQNQSIHVEQFSPQKKDNEEYETQNQSQGCVSNDHGYSQPKNRHTEKSL